jgi:hypothetical protein
MEPFVTCNPYLAEIDLTSEGRKNVFFFLI